MSEFTPTIGIEVHVEIKSKSKLFSSSANTYGMATNTAVNVIDLGYPGTLPTVNKEIVRQGVRTAHILNCDITRRMHFDRKNYFYPDNPKNYQITQNRTPIGRNGYVEIEVDGVKKKIEIEELHIEEDTCKSAHRGNVSLLDFNRAGVPLIEIVTKPCIKNGKEAMAYLTKLKELLFYANISDCKMEEGSMRCEPNISISKDDSFGTKVEVKNVSSIHNVGLAIDYEIKRQEEMLNNGETIKEETRRFDDKQGKTILMRVKETGNDYRYFIEPDIPYLKLTDEFINDSLRSLPLLPDELRNKYSKVGLNLLQIEKLINNRSLNDYFLGLLEYKTNYVTAVNLLLSDISSYLNKHNKVITDTHLSYEKLVNVVEALESGELSNKNVKDLINSFMENDLTLEELKKDFKIENITDDNFIKEVISKVIENNSDSVNDYKKGHDRALKYLMGQVMKETKGAVNPKKASAMLIEVLNKFEFR